MQGNAAQSIRQNNFSEGACPRNPIVNLRAYGARAKHIIHTWSGLIHFYNYIISNLDTYAESTGTSLNFQNTSPFLFAI